MQASAVPEKISTAFAESGGKQTIPVASQIGIADGRASYVDGFPPLTRTPIVAGGIPPFGTDMNGILYAITAIQKWQNAGGIPKFDAAFATAIGGYPKGAVLQKANESGWWVSAADSNSSNPDTGGANWKDAFAAMIAMLPRYGIDTGAANAYAVTYSPAVTALTDGMVLQFKAANTNTGVSTFNPNGLGARPIVYNSGAALGANTILANGDVWLQYNSSLGGGSWVLLAGQNFGNASLATVVANSFDTTAGRLLSVGYAGLGSTDLPDELTDTDTINLTGFHLASGAHTPSGAAAFLLAMTNAGNTTMQLSSPQGTNDLYLRGASGGAYGAWAKFFSTANISTFIQTLFDDADAAAAQTTLNGFGYNQTWQDVTASRALGTTYTNTSGRPIEVFINLDDNGATVGVSITIGGISWTTADPGSQAFMTPSFVVPPGNTYSVTGGSTLRKWLELR